MSIVEKILQLPGEQEKLLFGNCDEYAKLIERTLHVTMIERDGALKVLGTKEHVENAENVLLQLMEILEKEGNVTRQNVDYLLSLNMEQLDGAAETMENDCVCHTMQGKPIRPKTLGQKQYIDEMRKKMIVFGVGPAGTGKTYLAMAMAVKAFKQDEVSRIILTRPAIEAGEKLGFLPGDLQSKVDPYLRPLYDALYQIMGPEAYLRNTEKGLIEVAPLAYMRGRTLDNAFIILDEAQNTTPAQMKMFLTRIGFGSRAVITGDLTQKDLPKDTKSGLEHAVEVLKNIDEIGFSYLTSKDVVRHPLVQRIVKAYEDYDQKMEKSRKKKTSVKKRR
jgi:phosphate starvation-inducible PhoH-like protein